MKLTQTQRETLNEMILDDFELIYERYETNDFIEVHGSTGGDCYINRYSLKSDGSFEVYGK